MGFRPKIFPCGFSVRWNGVRLVHAATSGGFETGLKCYDTARRAVVPLVTRRPGVVTWYSCGPTVYDSAHVGHASSYVKLDLIRRILTKIFDLDCVYLLGVTDVDDKIITRSNEMGISYSGLARKYESEFHADMRKLGVMQPTAVTRVSDNIGTVLDFVQVLVDRGLAYRAPTGSVYFDTSEFRRRDFEYGKFVPLPNADSAEPTSGTAEKRNDKDFALWKAAKSGEPFWGSPFGDGRPGWHIECSAMASRVFGGWIDVHSGGLDLMFPHHENEEAQSCGYHDSHKWVGHWIHTGQLNVKGLKMSKSLKNFVTIRDILERFTPGQFRMMCMLSHYRSRIDFSDETMALAVNVHDKFLRFRKDCQSFIEQGGALGGGGVGCRLESMLTETKQRVKHLLRDDFKVPGAVQCLTDLISETYTLMASPPPSGEVKRDGAGAVDSVCGAVGAVAEYVTRVMGDFGVFADAAQFGAGSEQQQDFDLASVLDSVVSFRSAVRDFALARSGLETSSPSLDKDERKRRLNERKPLLAACDKLRDELLTCGVAVKDTQGKAQWDLRREHRTIDDGCARRDRREDSQEHP